MICLPFDTKVRLQQPPLSGLDIDLNTGIIDVSNSVSGTYVVSATWTEPTSGKSHIATSTVTIGDSDPSFNYPLNIYCKSTVSVVTPTISGDIGGVFSASASLTLNTATGEITPIYLLCWNLYRIIHNRWNMHKNFICNGYYYCNRYSNTFIL